MLRTLLALSLLLALAACQKAPKPPALTREAYVWQHVSTPAVDQAILRASPVLDGLCLLAAHISFGRKAAETTTIDIPWRTLEKTHRPVGLAIRIPFAPWGLANSDEEFSAVSDHIETLLAAAAKYKVPVSEIQIDYDCPDSKLADYAAFLRRLRAAHPQPPLAFTALPSWLKQSTFPALAQSTGRYILQVHSLALPDLANSQTTLCDIPAAREAISRASAIGIPFRVALPTYTSVVLMDAFGRPSAVFSESETPIPAERLAKVSVFRYAADPASLAALVHDLTTNSPPHLTGLIWYRLPVDTDRRNWPWETFLAVSSGHAPLSRLTIAFEPNDKGFTTVFLRNTGQTPEPLPAAIEIAYPPAPGIAADALGPYRLGAFAPDKTCQFLLRPDSALQPDLLPGKSLPIGWIRHPQPASLRAN